jgi:hypothetical protein
MRMIFLRIAGVFWRDGSARNSLAHCSRSSSDTDADVRSVETPIIRCNCKVFTRLSSLANAAFVCVTFYRSLFGGSQVRISDILTRF